MCGGSVECWGVQGGKIWHSKPQRVQALAKEHVVDVACGADHTIALTKEGEVSSTHRFTGRIERWTGLGLGTRPSRPVDWGEQ